MAGAGINERNFLELYEATGCIEYHLSASVSHKSNMLYENPKLNETLPSAYTATDSTKVEAVCSLASFLSA
jgi:copper homeostasis protein CutC